MVITDQLPVSRNSLDRERSKRLIPFPAWIAASPTAPFELSHRRNSPVTPPPSWHICIAQPPEQCAVTHPKLTSGAAPTPAVRFQDPQKRCLGCRRYRSLRRLSGLSLFEAVQIGRRSVEHSLMTQFFGQLLLASQNHDARHPVLQARADFRAIAIAQGGAACAQSACGPSCRIGRPGGARESRKAREYPACARAAEGGTGEPEFPLHQ